MLELQVHPAHARSVLEHVLLLQPQANPEQGSWVVVVVSARLLFSAYSCPHSPTSWCTRRQSGSPHHQIRCSPPALQSPSRAEAIQRWNVNSDPRHTKSETGKCELNRQQYKANQQCLRFESCSRGPCLKWRTNPRNVRIRVYD
jgi:hypothetical protein